MQDLKAPDKQRAYMAHLTNLSLVYRACRI